MLCTKLLKYLIAAMGMVAILLFLFSLFLRIISRSTLLLGVGGAKLLAHYSILRFSPLAPIILLNYTYYSQRFSVLHDYSVVINSIALSMYYIVTYWKDPR